METLALHYSVRAAVVLIWLAQDQTLLNYLIFQVF